MGQLRDLTMDSTIRQTTSCWGVFLLICWMTACSGRQATPPTPSTVTTPTQTVKDKVKKADDALQQREKADPAQPSSEASPEG